MPIAVAGWPTLNLGKSYDGYTHTEPAYGTANPAVGHYFRQQFEWALNATCHDDSFHCEGVPADDSALPEAVFVTGWNEWIAGRFIVGPSDVIDFCGERLQPGESYFVDEYIEEYSRDIEAMKGGHRDNYYYQLVAMVRWLKGAGPALHYSSQPHSLPSTADGLLSRSWWAAVGPVYYDTVNDTQTRSHAGFGDTGLYYTDNSTVDDLCEMQLAVPASDQSWWAARIAACDAFHPSFSNHSTPPPLTLFILVTAPARASNEPHAAASNATTIGYNWKLNATESTLYVADVNAIGGADWRAVRDNITVVWDSSQLVVILPIPLPANATIEFKAWSGKEWDVTLTDPIDFMLYGDAAPNARFNYRYQVNDAQAQNGGPQLSRSGEATGSDRAVRD